MAGADLEEKQQRYAGEAGGYDRCSDQTDVVTKNAWGFLDGIPCFGHLDDLGKDRQHEG